MGVIRPWHIVVFLSILGIAGALTAIIVGVTLLLRRKS